MGRKRGASVVFSDADTATEMGAGMMKRRRMNNGGAAAGGSGSAGGVHRGTIVW